MIKNLLIIVLSFSLGACNNKPAPKPVEEPQIKLKYIKYYIRYLEAGRELQIDAKYHSDSAAIALPDGLYIGEERLNAKELPREGWVHRFIRRGREVDTSYIFRYKISKSVEVQDTVEMPFYTDFELATTNISKKKGGVLTWKGKPLLQGDGLVMIFEDTKGNNFTHTHRGVTQGTQFVIRPELVETLYPGKVTLRIVHKHETRETIAKQQILKQSEFYRTPIIFELVD